MNRSQKRGNKAGRGGKGQPQTKPLPTPGAPKAAPVDPRVAREAEEAQRRAREEQERIAKEQQEKLREQREKEEKIRQEQARIAEIERRKREAEEAANRAKEEQLRMLQNHALQEKAKLEEQRRQVEEALKVRKEAIARAEAERVARMEEMHVQIQKTREVAASQIAIEKENRERLERLRKEVDAQQVSNYGNKPKVVVPVVRATPVNRGGTPARSGANFAPQTSLDYSVFTIYHSRSAPDEQLPSVTFSRRGEGLFFLGVKKCVIEEMPGGVYVKKGQDYEPLQQWLERNERVEGLRLKGLKSANTFVSFQQSVVF